MWAGFMSCKQKRETIDGGEGAKYVDGDVSIIEQQREDRTGEGKRDNADQ